MKKLLCATLLSAAAVFSMAAQSNNLQPLAVVKLNGNETVTLKEVKDAVEVYQAQAGGKKFTVEQRKAILESVISQKLFVQAAKKEGLSVTDSQIDQLYIANMSQIVGRMVTEKELADIIRQETGKSVDEFLKSQVRMNVAQYKNSLKSNVLAQQYVMKKKGAEIQAISADDKEIRDFYEMNKAKLIWADTVRVVFVSALKGNDAAGAQKKIEGYRKDFISGKIEVADLISQGQNPDKTGFMAAETYVAKTQEYAAAMGMSYENLLNIFKQKLNTPSEITDSGIATGFYIVLEKIDGKMLGLSDPYQPGTNVTVYEYIKQFVTAQKQQTGMLKAIEEIRKELNTPANVDYKKKGADLDALLNW